MTSKNSLARYVLDGQFSGGFRKGVQSFRDYPP